MGARVRAGARRFWLAILLTLIVVGAATYVLLGTSVFGVRQIEVTGSTIAGPEKVRAAAAVELGSPLARVDTDGIVERVKALPSVADVDVSRSWPSTLVIAVTERHAVAVVAAGGQFLVLDGTGVVFNRVATRPAGAVLLSVPSPGVQDPGTRAGLEVIGALTPALRTLVKRVVADDGPNNLWLDLTDGRVIVWGDATQSGKKAQVATALLGYASKRIDVSAPEVAVTS